MRKLYKRLKVDKDATQEEIKSSFRKLVRKYHPDKNHKPGSAEKFSKIKEAYDILSDPDKRKEYDSGKSKSEINGTRENTLASEYVIKFLITNLQNFVIHNSWNSIADEIESLKEKLHELEREKAKVEKQITKLKLLNDGVLNKDNSVSSKFYIAFETTKNQLNENLNILNENIKLTKKVIDMFSNLDDKNIKKNSRYSTKNRVDIIDLLMFTAANK